MSSNCCCCDDAPLCVEKIAHNVAKVRYHSLDKRMKKKFIECDNCWREFDVDNLPQDSFQTYNGEWFCSAECGKKAGW